RLIQKQFQKFCQFLGNLANEFKPFAGFRMIERKLFGMKKNAAKALDGIAYLDVRYRFVASFVICFVADDRMVHRGKMYANLVRSAGFYFNVQQREFFETAADFPEGYCGSAVCRDGHFRTVPPVAAVRPVDGSDVVACAAVYECDVVFVN